jgi:hypothetical protein
MAATNPTTTPLPYDILTDDGIQDATANSPDWQTAVRDAIEYLTEKNEAFSSGEIAAMLRTHRTDLRFAATRVGEMVRDGFYMGEIEYVDEYGSPVPAVQVPRVTQGLGRTPPGHTVFVYAPDQIVGEDHEFEIDIPVPGGAPAQTAPQAPASTPAAPPQPKPATGPKIHGVPSGVALRLTVHIDNRVCVTRSAFEALVHAAGKSFQCGASVYVHFDGDDAKVSLEEVTGATTHRVTKRGRILFPNVANATPFAPGAVFSAKVVDDELVIAVSKDLRK